MIRRAAVLFLMFAVAVWFITLLYLAFLAGMAGVG
jgi:hypothetical protein